MKNKIAYLAIATLLLSVTNLKAADEGDELSLEDRIAQGDFNKLQRVDEINLNGGPIVNAIREGGEKIGQVVTNTGGDWYVVKNSSKTVNAINELVATGAQGFVVEPLQVATGAAELVVGFLLIIPSAIDRSNEACNWLTAGLDTVASGPVDTLANGIKAAADTIKLAIAVVLIEGPQEVWESATEIVSTTYRELGKEGVWNFVETLFTRPQNTPEAVVGIVEGAFVTGGTVLKNVVGKPLSVVGQVVTKPFTLIKKNKRNSASQSSGQQKGAERLQSGN